MSSFARKLVLEPTTTRQRPMHFLDTSRGILGRFSTPRATDLSLERFARVLVAIWGRLYNQHGKKRHFTD